MDTEVTLEHIKLVANNLARVDNYESKNLDHWVPIRRKDAPNILDMSKTIEVFEDRISRMGILLARRGSELALSWYVLSGDAGAKTFVLYIYSLDFHNLYRPDGRAFSRQRIGFFSHHLLLRMSQRQYRKLTDILYVCYKSFYDEHDRLIELYVAGQKFISEYSEKSIKAIDGGVFAVGYEPPSDPEFSHGVLIGKTYISPEMVRGFNKAEITCDYYHLDHCNLAQGLGDILDATKKMKTSVPSDKLRRKIQKETAKAKRRIRTLGFAHFCTELERFY